MKKLLLIATCMLAALAVNAQGTITFGNSSTTLVKYGTTADVPTALQGTAVPTTGGFNVALYWLNGSTFEQVGASAGIAPVAGRFAGGTRTVTGLPAGNSGTFMVKTWSGGATFSSYDAAAASGNASIFIGESSSFSNGTGGAGSPPGPAVALSGFTGITNVRPVPEPSIVALGLLGAAALCLRRRNS